MKSMMKKELSAVCSVLKKANVHTVHQEQQMYNCCILNGPGCEDNDYEVIYILNENGVRLGDHNRSQYGSCKLDLIKTRWVHMAENGYNIKETIKFQFESASYVRMVVHVTNHFDFSQGDMSRIEFAFGNIIFGISYILPLYVWELHCEEIEDIFRDRGTGLSMGMIPGDWNVVATFKQNT